MVRFDPRTQAFAISLSAVAGYVDAIGFLKLGGFFVSFMSGNSTRLAVGLVNGTPSATEAAGLIAGFVLGVMLGTGIGHIRPILRSRYVLLCITVLLGAAPLLDLYGFAVAALFAMTLAMGAENTIFAQNGEVRVGVTYMTGTLVKLGQGLMMSMLQRRSPPWWPYLALWLGLIGGAVTGANAYAHFGLQSLWLAAAVTAVLSIIPATVLAPRN